jgi:molybdopterin biosynthesis enzyme
MKLSASNVLAGTSAAAEALLVVPPGAEGYAEGAAVEAIGF